VRERDNNLVYDKGIPLVPRKKNDIFNGNIKNPGEAIAVGIILIGGMALIYWIFLMACGH